MLQGDAAADQAPEPHEFWLWPDNVQAWHCWIGVQTQWRVGMSGATGLDYMKGVEIFKEGEAR